MWSSSWYTWNLSQGVGPNYVQGKYFLSEQRIVAIIGALTFEIDVESNKTGRLLYGWPTMRYFPGKVA